MPFWGDLFQLFGDIFRDDPLTASQSEADVEGGGHTLPDMIELRGDPGAMAWAGRESTALADMNSWSTRRARYKEYERLRQAVPEIHTMLTVISDEACIVGDTAVSTPFGSYSISDLASLKAPGERFLVYSYDFVARDYTLAWAHDPRLVKTAATVEIFMDDGSKLRCTPDHRVLLRDGGWSAAGDLKVGDELMPFYRERPRQCLTGVKHAQFPRIFSHRDGWKHERQVIDEWRAGHPLDRYQKLNEAMRLVGQGLTTRQIPDVIGVTWKSVEAWMHREGFSHKEAKYLSSLLDRRRVVGVTPAAAAEVYDLSVDEHENFATDCCIVHNCQTGENGHMFDIRCGDSWVKEESESLLYERLNIEDDAWSEFFNLAMYGDRFWELVIDPRSPDLGVVQLQSLPPDTMFKIETTRGRTLEFQQARDAPDYDVLRTEYGHDKLNRSMGGPPVIRFQPEQMLHLKIGDNRKLFYPYGVALLEAARTPAHMLRLMEDAMLVYRLTRAPERRVFYIDVAQLPGWKAESVIERIKDQFRKKKVPNSRGGLAGESVEERWHAPAQDEDYWLPTRANGATKIETLPGAQNLGEIDDALYFRRKLYVAMNFPSDFGEQTDVQQTRVTLSASNCRFARFIERLQKPFARAVQELLRRHFHLMGVSEERYHDIHVMMTPPSDWREISRNEVIEARYNRAAAMKGAQLISDYDIMVDILRYDKEKAKDYNGRMKQQKMEDLKLQVMGQNPKLLGLGEDDQPSAELGASASGPNPDQMPAPGGMPPEGMSPGGDMGGGEPPIGQGQSGAAPGGAEPLDIPTPSKKDIETFDLGIRDYSREGEDEEVDRGELGES